MNERSDPDAGSLLGRALTSLPGKHAKRGVIAVGVFLTLGLINIALLLRWGGMWAIGVLPPVLFVCVLVWIVFGTDFLEGRT